MAKFFSEEVEDGGEVLAIMFSRREIEEVNGLDPRMTGKLKTYYEAVIVKPMAERLCISQNQFKMNMLIEQSPPSVVVKPIEDLSIFELAEFIERVAKWCETEHGFRVVVPKLSDK